MNNIECVLFDLDGVVLDTEVQYDVFWGNVGKKYKPEIDHFERVIKGTTLPNILKNHFENLSETQLKELVNDLDIFEANMDFREIKGSIQFIKTLKASQFKVGLVTSSMDSKMKAVNNAIHLDLLFDDIVTAAHVKQGKPNPECFLIAAKHLNVKPESCLVFEDSLAGIDAVTAAGMKVIGLATTLPKEKLEVHGKCQAIIPNFDGMTVDKLLNLLR